ncbi:hypothetical protein BH18ACT7_BH18ACT7_09810 [soil metagenome]
MSVEAPWSYGQLYSWREVETYPTQWLAEANLPATCDLRGHSPQTVQRALAGLVRRHEALRTTFRLDDGVPTQRIEDRVDLPLVSVDRPVSGPADADRTTTELLTAPFPMTGGLCWRGVLVCSGGTPVFLSLSFSHLIVDVWSVRELQAQFEALLRDPDSPSQLPDLSPRELARREREQTAGRRQLAVQRYWQGVLADSRVPQLPTTPPRVTRPRIQATLHSHQLGGLAASAAKRHGVTAPAVVLAMVVAGLAGHTGTDRVVISLMSSNRFLPEHRRVVSTLNQLIPVVADADRACSLSEHITRLNWASAKAYRHSSYDVDQVRTLAAADGSFNRLFPTWFNYLQLDDVPADPRDPRPAVLEWTPTARPYGQPFDVRVTARQGRTSVAMRVDPELISATALVGMLRRLAFGVQEAVSSPETRVGDLLEVSPASLPAALFPASVPPPPQ